EDITSCGIPQQYNASQEFADKKVVLFAVPGAFTPGCSVRHLPGFIDHLSEIKSKGVDVVAVIAFNDAWVMSAWAKANKIKDEMLFMTDTDTRFSKDIGWMKGDRTGRYAMIVDHGKITYAQNEPGGDVTRNTRSAVLNYVRLPFDFNPKAGLLFKLGTPHGQGGIKMFRFVSPNLAVPYWHEPGVDHMQHKSLDVITLFHKASSPASIRAQTLLKQISAHASESATEDQATDHTQQNKFQRTEFELNVTEDPPTSDQLRTILEYVGSGAGRAGQIVEGATSEADAVTKLKENPDSFQRPVIVDWNNGRAGKTIIFDAVARSHANRHKVFGYRESEIMKMIRQLPKETNSV
ncbi:MAG: hypothetical protein Q9180_004218, partial [Flavoplaca navasiana]